MSITHLLHSLVGYENHLDIPIHKINLYSENEMTISTEWRKKVVPITIIPLLKT